MTWLNPRAARSVLQQPPEQAALRLLGAQLAGPDGVVVEIVEVEAYGGQGVDPASHCFGGPTPRNAPMFGQVGHLYAYLSYGIHTCLNVVAHEGAAEGAVLLRAARVVAGQDLAHRGRDHLAARELASGPGRLGTTLGFELSASGVDLLASSALRVRRSPSGPVQTGPRIGISAAKETPWRFWLDTDEVSGSRRRLPKSMGGHQEAGTAGPLAT